MKLKMSFNFISKVVLMMRSLALVLGALSLSLVLPAAAQQPPGIQDNSFLIEESYRPTISRAVSKSYPASPPPSASAPHRDKSVIVYLSFEQR